MENHNRKIDQLIHYYLKKETEWVNKVWESEEKTLKVRWWIFCSNVARFKANLFIKVRDL